MIRNLRQCDDWRWQLANRITTIEQLAPYIELTDEECQGIASASKRFTWGITPYYASLMNRTDRNCPIRMQAVPTAQELEDELGVADPLQEEQNSPVDLLIHVYPDRVAFCVGNRCPVYCRHCLRKETMVGKPDMDFTTAKLTAGLDYIRGQKRIRDVLLTGGDALLMKDEQLADILERLHAIPTVEVVRIGTRTCCTLPQRITPELCRVLAKHHPLYINTQFNHAREITPQAEQACAMLASAGIPLGNQSVLLRGINDNLAAMRRLCTELMRIRVRPYYLYQAQILRGTRHFRTSIESGIELMRGLQGHISGLAVPKYLLDTPYGKIPLADSYVVGREGDDVVMRSWDGKLWREPNPLGVNQNVCSCSCEAGC